MKITNAVSRTKAINLRQEMQTNQSNGEIFGLAATTVFLVMLILNAISH
jgi:hypothetical protein